MKKILIIANRSFNLIRARLPLMKLLIKKGWEVHAAAKPHDDLEIGLLKYGIIFHPLDIQRATISPIKDAKAIININRLVKNINPKIVHYFNTKSILLGGLVMPHNYQSYVTMTGLEFTNNSTKDLIVRLALMLPMRRSNGVIYETEEDKIFCEKHFLSHPKKGYIGIASGVDLSLFNDMVLPKKIKLPIVFFFAGRLVKTKGIKELLEASVKLKNEFGDRIEIRIAGETEDNHVDCFPMKEINPYIERKIIVYLGKLSPQEMLANYNQAHVAILPSYREGYSKFLMEAAAAGKALIATDTPGCRNIVMNGSNGLLIKPKSSTDIYLAVKYFLKKPFKILEYGKKAKNMAYEKFDQNKNAYDVLKIYKI